jgi:hypothetical protein
VSKGVGALLTATFFVATNGKVTVQRGLTRWISSGSWAKRSGSTASVTRKPCAGRHGRHRGDVELARPASDRATFHLPDEPTCHPLASGRAAHEERRELGPGHPQARSQDGDTDEEVPEKSSVHHSPLIEDRLPRCDRLIPPLRGSPGAMPFQRGDFQAPCGNHVHDVASVGVVVGVHLRELSPGQLPTLDHPGSSASARSSFRRVGVLQTAARDGGRGRHCGETAAPITSSCPAPPGNAD